jgi:hypothetical protein
MSTPTIRIHNLETNEIIDREMNQAELAQLEQDKAEFAAREQEAAKTAEAKAALLDRLGITEAEAKLLLS